MALFFLEELEQAHFPLTVTSPEGVRKVFLLQSALLIDADVHPIHQAPSTAGAVVLAIRPRGWAMLQKRKSRKRGLLPIPSRPT